MINPLFLIIFVLLFNSSFSQEASSFKAYKNSQTGTLNAYSDGLKFYYYKTDQTYLFSQTGTQTSTRIDYAKLYPKFDKNQNYLILENIIVSNDYSFEESHFPSCQFGVTTILIYIKINDETVLTLTGYGSGNASKYSNNVYKYYKFSIPQKSLKSICDAESVKIKFSCEKLETFEDFDFDFSNEELYGFRDFAAGMKKTFQNGK